MMPPAPAPIRCPRPDRGSAALRFAVLAGVAALSGCTTLGPQFHPEAIAAPAQWDQQHGGSADLGASGGVAAAPGPHRWEVFQDPELNRLLALAAQANPDARTAALRVLQARMDETMVSAQRGVQLDAQGGINRERQSEYGSAARLVSAIGGAQKQILLQQLSSPFTLYQAGFDASWEPDLWGRVLRSEEAAQANTGAQSAALRQVQLSVAAELARDYFALRSAQRQRRLVEDERASAQELLGLLRAQVDTGLIDESAWIQQRSAVAALGATLPALSAQEAQAMNQITLLCGAQPGEFNERLALAQAARAPDALPDLRLGLPSELARHRPDIAAAEARLHAATANIGIAAADLYPRITLGATFGLESVGSQRVADWGSRQWSVGPSLSVPVFDHGRRRAMVTLRELEQQEAAVAYQQTVLKAWHDVDDAIAGFVAETQRDVDFRRRVRDAQAQADLAQARYAQGLTSYVPVVNATGAWIEARRDQEQSTARVQTALAAVYKSLGDDNDTVAAPR